MKNTKWILGSQSPRRKELLSGIGIDFEIRTKDTDENYPNELAVQDVAEYLAQVKAEALLHGLAPDETIICADTVVIIHGEILGKPKNQAEAQNMLRKLSGNTHEVITGVFIGNHQKKISFSESTLVTFEALSDEQINYYLEKYQPYDKAGSYGVQEWLGYVAVKKLVGTYTNVMGLPTNRLYQELKFF